MVDFKKFLSRTSLRFFILIDFFRTLWKYKLWWGIPVISLIMFILLFLLIAGQSGVAAFIYPLF